MTESAMPRWSSHISALQKEYQEQFLELFGDIEGRLSAQDSLNHSSARYHGEVIGVGFLPKLYDEEALNYFDAAIDCTYGILEKITKRFIEDQEYRSLFRFSPLLESLILLPSGYECVIPISRIDIFLNEEDGSFKFCEFNTDGSSAMNEDLGITNALATSCTFKKFALNHEVAAQELFDPWIEIFMDIFNSSDYAIPDPTIAIIDYMESAVVDEQLEFRNRFAQYGVNCLVADVSSLEYRDEKLYARDISENHPAHAIPLEVDGIYRRAVTYELLQELQKTPEISEAILSGELDSNEPLYGAYALLAAIKNRKVCMIGGFKTQVAHSKAVYCMLHHPETLSFLSDEECEFIKSHVPYTTWLKENCIDIAAVKANPDKWIIKPVDGYASKGVEAGISVSADDWANLIDEKLKEDYIIQEYCSQYKMLNTLPVPYSKDGALLFDDLRNAETCADQELFFPENLEPYNVLTGLYCYGGKFCGVYVRSGQNALIVGFRGGVTLASFLVDYKENPELNLWPRLNME